MANNKYNKQEIDYIQNIYNFKKVWKDQCSKYNINEQPNILPAVDRIIVLGDIHGDWEMTQKLLKVAKLIDDNGNWIGKDTVVVQVGDQIDRCRYKIDSALSCDKPEATNPDEGNDWKILKYFTELHNQAQKVGGAVYSLMGNHELMNVNGDFRYVSYEGRREFIDYKKPDGTTIENGDDARRWAFQPGNPISNFLACTRQTALIIGSNLFVHAGILPQIANKYSITELNEKMSLYLFDILRNSSEYSDILNKSESPLWNRVFGNMGLNKLDKSKETKLCSELLNPLFTNYKVDKIYIGHTPLMNDGISSRCDNRVWLTDFGASKAFDAFDKTSIYSESSDTNPYPRSDTRKPQVLEILKDGKEINILF